MLVQDYFTKEEIIDVLADSQEYHEPSFEELFEAMFNNSDYIIYTQEAAEALEAFENDEKLDGYQTDLDGVFGAIGLVKQYETDQFGEVSTPLDDPQQIANMVEYIRGENLFNKALDRAGLDFDSETTEENIKKFVGAAKES